MTNPKDRTADFEKALQNRDGQRYSLRLFITGMTPRSMEAITTIRKVCEEHLQGRYEIEVVDLYQHPEEARRQHVVAAPTLVRELPHPLRKLIGWLSDEERILKGLDLKPKS